MVCNMRNVFIVCVAVSLAFLSGCQRPYEMDYDFALNRDQMRFTKAESKAYFLVYSKSAWSVEFESPVDWATLSRTEGSGNGQVSVFCQANTSVSRGVNIVVTTSDGVSKKVYLSQESGFSDGYYIIDNPTLQLLSKGVSVSLAAETNMPEDMFDEIVIKVDPAEASEWIKDIVATPTGISCVVADYEGTESRQATVGVYFPAAEWDESRVTSFMNVVQSCIAPQVKMAPEHVLDPTGGVAVSIPLEFNWAAEFYTYDLTSHTFGDDSWISTSSYDAETQSLKVTPLRNKSGQPRETVLTCYVKDLEGLVLSGASTVLKQDVFDGIDPVDAVALYDGEKYANSYLIETTQANTYWIDAKKPDGSLPSENMASAEVLWQNVTSPVDKVLYEDGKIYFRTVSDKNGNAVIVVKDADGVICWSWHIWVAGTAVSTNTVDSYIFMDRNIGALSFEGKDARGLHFEWGRKDPFPGAVYSDAASSLDRQTVSPDIINSVKEQNGKTIEWTIQNPHLYVSGSDNSAKEDWYYDGSDVKAQDNTLWGDGTEKSVYDPCPYGYRVPSKDALDKLAVALKSGSTYTKYDGVRTKDDNEASLYFPVSGWWQRKYNELELCNVGTQGRLWSSTPSAENALNKEYFSSYVLHCTSATNSSTQAHVRRWGCNVRCVKLN